MHGRANILEEKQAVECGGGWGRDLGGSGPHILRLWAFLATPLQTVNNGPKSSTILRACNLLFPPANNTFSLLCVIRSIRDKTPSWPPLMMVTVDRKKSNKLVIKEV